MLDGSSAAGLNIRERKSCTASAVLFKFISRVEAQMEALLQMGGYIVSVLAAAAIVAGIEALNERCPYGAGPAMRPVPLPVTQRPRGGLRQERP
jgi:hypothetical protein